MDFCSAKNVLEDSLTNFLKTGWYRVVSQVTCVKPHGSVNAEVTDEVVFSSTSGSSLEEAFDLDPTAGYVAKTFPTENAAPVNDFSLISNFSVNLRQNFNFCVYVVFLFKSQFNSCTDLVGEISLKKTQNSQNRSLMIHAFIF